MEIYVSETFSGEIEGEGVVRFLQAVRDDGSPSFVGIERVTGRIGGREGSFLLQDAGTLEGSIVRGEWFVGEKERALLGIDRLTSPRPWVTVCPIGSAATGLLR